MHIYLIFFGFVTMGIEAKDIDFLENWKSIISTWMKFLTVPGGKGSFYIFCGITGVSLCSSNWVALILGCFAIVLGIICIMVHLGLRKNVEDLGIELSKTQYPVFNNQTLHRRLPSLDTRAPLMTVYEEEPLDFTSARRNKPTSKKDHVGNI
eukprot:GHVP01064996.1.p1 GENE.GHVP01064996.1~~GHVP01064996.1.p1  ORF type:complete len:152 (+),score=16.39 GHVP01064996.1:381-836(+)